MSTEHRVELFKAREVIHPAVIFELPPTPERTISVLFEVEQERRRQDRKFGQQNRPWCDGQAPFIYLSGLHTADAVKAFVDMEAERGTLHYSEILYEEVAEALEETDIVRAREELIQVAAVAVAAIESIDRNGR